MTLIRGMKMAITDEQGNKIPQPRIKKRDKSKAERATVASKAKQGKSKRCPDCGYRVRTTGHSAGTHHIQNSD
jgi:hypothetical protein